MTLAFHRPAGFASAGLFYISNMHEISPIGEISCIIPTC